VASPIRAACEQSASRSGSRGESRDRKPSPARWAMAFRPRLSPCSISSRYGSQALVARFWLPVGGEIGWPKSVVTSLAGFAGARRPQPAAGRTAIPAALRNSQITIAVLQFLPREQALILATHSERPAEARFSIRLQAQQRLASARRREVYFTLVLQGLLHCSLHARNVGQREDRPKGSCGSKRAGVDTLEVGG